MPIAEEAVKIGCILFREYLGSVACGKGFAFAEEMEKLVAVTTMPDMQSFRETIQCTDVKWFPSGANPVWYIKADGQVTTSNEDVPAAIIGVM